MTTCSCLANRLLRHCFVPVESALGLVPGASMVALAYRFNLQIWVPGSFPWKTLNQIEGIWERGDGVAIFLPLFWWSQGNVRVHFLFPATYVHSPPGRAFYNTLRWISGFVWYIEAGSCRSGRFRTVKLTVTVPGKCRREGNVSCVLLFRSPGTWSSLFIFCSLEKGKCVSGKTVVSYFTGLSVQCVLRSLLT